MGKIRVKSLWLTLLTCLATIFIVGNTQSIQADQTVNQMDINVSLDDQGTAYITEDWSVTADEGSEIYKVVKLVGPQKLSDYQVSMDGQAFQRKNNWNTKANRQQKANRYGQNGDELNWGITKYGTHQYRIQYQISNFVEQTKTKQMIAWQFLDSDVAIAPKQMKVTIQDPNRQFSVNNGYGVWGFGFEGKTAFKNDKLTMQSTSAILEDDYVKMIVQIPKGTYATNYHSNRTFDAYIKDAFKGSDYDYHDYKNGQTVTNDRAVRIVIWVMVAIGVVFIAITIWIIQKYRNYRKYYPKMKKLQAQTKGEYRREVPTGSIYNTYLFFSDMYSLTDTLDNFLTVGLLQLVKDGQITMEEEPSTFGKPKAKFVLTDKPVADDAPAPIKRYYKIMTAAAHDGVVTQKGLSKYLNGSSSRHKKLTMDYRTYSREYLEGHDLMYPKDAKKIRTGDKKLDSANRIAGWIASCRTKPAGFEVKQDLARLKNYLEEFTLLDERAPQEVGLWDDLMIAAAAFGILEEVADELAKVYPNYQQDSVYYYSSRYPFRLVNHFSTSVATQTRSSGGGGSTSSGGGGSHGGSSGGGGFR